MAKGIDELVNNVVKDNVNKLEHIVAFVATSVKYDWEREARRVLDDYYSDSSELTGRYKRTDELMKNVVVPVLETSGNNYIAGIKFDPSRMNHDDAFQFGEYGIWLNFLYGRHGTEDYTSPLTGDYVRRNIHFTTPYARSVLDKYYDNYDKKIDEFFKMGKDLFG